MLSVLPWELIGLGFRLGMAFDFGASKENEPIRTIKF